MVISIRRVFDEVQKNTMPGYGYDSGNGYFGYGNPYDDSLPDGYGDSDDSNGYYKPDEKDDYYEEITDATSQDLDYKVIWESVSMRPDDSDDSCTYDGVYPVLRDEEGQEEEKFSSMNQKIRDMVCKYKDAYRDYASGISSSGYGVLALVFNSLALGITGLDGDLSASPWWAVALQIAGASIILLIGHGINLFMSTISSLVHPMRLTFVEFYKNAGFEMTTRAFQPLTETKTNNEN